MEKKDKDNYMVPIRDTIPTRDVPVVTWLLIGGEQRPGVVDR